MPLNFNLDTIRSTEFGVGRDDEDEGSFSLIPVDGDVQDALREMAAETWDAMSDNEDPEEYQPSEKYASQEYVYTPTESEMVARLRNLHRANNLTLDTTALEEPGDVSCYFARFSDARGRRLTAVRRATQFKGLLKSRNKLIRLIEDTLQIVEDNTFKLDRDFDLLIDSTIIHILRPSGFEFIAKLQEVIREAVPDNIASIQEDMPYVDFASIQEYASGHTRAARLLASIRSLRETHNISQRLLRNACRTYGLEVRVRNGQITIPAGSEMTFLDILDRRMYELELVEGAPEQYKAGSRRRVGTQAR
jgi:hypothetical protein